jgi:hypothetical protein
MDGSQPSEGLRLACTGLARTRVEPVGIERAIYFGRYIETMRKLQAITMSLPIEHAPSA